MIQTLIFVAAGGAIGASLRYLLGVGVYRLTGGPTDFPVAIMAANVIGSFLMGAFVILAAERGLTHYAPFVMIGLLGGFTTFSSFSLETIRLIQDGNVLHAGFYVTLSVGLSLLGLVAGLWCTRMMFQ